MGELNAFSYSRLACGITHQFLTLDRKTNAIVHSKIYKYKKNEDGHKDYKAADKFEYDIVEEDFPEKDWDNEI